jgi:hypothetical protein
VSQFLSSVLGLVRVQFHAPSRFTPLGKNPRYPLDGMLGGPQGRYEGCGEEKSLLPLLGIKPLPSSPEPVAVPTDTPYSKNYDIFVTKEM